jgi:hypothetical protein
MEDYCERCGELGEGREQWMFRSGQLPRKEFFCTRCLGILRVYSVIGLTLLAILFGGILTAVIWLVAFGP